MACGGARDYDVVLFGATGYTGKFVAEELQRLQRDGRRALKWAAAGRNRAKVITCLQGARAYSPRLRAPPLPPALPSEVGVEGVDVLVADVSDPASLEGMCARAVVLINCVGPVSTRSDDVVQC